MLYYERVSWFDYFSFPMLALTFLRSYLMYFLYASLFHLPKFLISSDEYPNLAATVAPPILNECDVMFVKGKQIFDMWFNLGLRTKKMVQTFSL